MPAIVKSDFFDSIGQKRTSRGLTLISASDLSCVKTRRNISKKLRIVRAKSSAVEFGANDGKDLADVAVEIFTVRSDNHHLGIGSLQPCGMRITLP